MVCTEVKISKISLSGLAEIAFLESFLYTPPRFQRTEDFALEFPGYVRRKRLGILLPLIGLLFSQQKR